MHWICPGCQETNEREFDVCWNCETDRGSSPIRGDEPPVMDATFGELSWDGELQCWVGNYPCDASQPFALAIQTASPEARVISDAARAAFNRVRSNLEAIRRQTAEEFLPELNEHWAPAPLAMEDFLSVLALETISIEPDGYLEVGFADGSADELLGGHVLVSRFWPDGLREVVLER